LTDAVFQKVITAAPSAAANDSLMVASSIAMVASQRCGLQLT